MEAKTGEKKELKTTNKDAQKKMVQ